MEPMLDYIERLATSPIKDEDFASLKEAIRKAMDTLDNLQKIFRRETGRYYVP